MKINAYSLTLSSDRSYSKTQTIQTRETVSFNEVMAAGARNTPPTALSRGLWGPAVSAGGSHFNPVSGETVQTVSLTESFMAQLEILRQIAQEILNKFQEQLSVSASFQLISLDDIYAGFNFEFGGSLVRQWETTRTEIYTHSEAETVTVSGQGTVMTADNQAIDFSMDLLMERQFFQESFVQYTESGYTLVDPLVIQTNLETPMLVDAAQFSIDLDLDGETEDLPMLNSGLAFLALDLNQDGTINDGSELFGPATGDGFGELSAYDQDNNQWIDENDEMFDQFVLWTPGDNSGTLTRLKDADIGAIYLNGVSSPFSLTTADNTLLGQVSETSLALTESGQALPVYEIKYNV